MTAFLFIGIALIFLSCGPSETDIQNVVQARRDSLAQSLAGRETAVDSTETPMNTDTRREFSFNDSGRFVVQVGSWRSGTKAGEMTEVWKSRGYSQAFVESYGDESIGDVWFRVRLGRMSSRSDADALVRQIKQRNGLVAWVDTISIP